MHVFISYRRHDSATFVQRLNTFLADTIGQRKVFMDVDSIPIGSDFPELIQQYVNHSDIVLIVIGPAWLSSCNEHGIRRLDDPDDWVRIEVESALSSEAIVIPVILPDAALPTSEQLPQSLASLATRNAYYYHSDEDFEATTTTLLRKLHDLKKPFFNKNTSDPLLALSALLTVGVAAPLFQLAIFFLSYVFILLFFGIPVSIAAWFGADTDAVQTVNFVATNYGFAGFSIFGFWIYGGYCRGILTIFQGCVLRCVIGALFGAFFGGCLLPNVIWVSCDVLPRALKTDMQLSIIYTPLWSHPVVFACVGAGVGAAFASFVAHNPQRRWEYVREGPIRFLDVLD